MGARRELRLKIERDQAELARMECQEVSVSNRNLAERYRLECAEMEAKLREAVNRDPQVRQSAERIVALLDTVRPDPSWASPAQLESVFSDIRHNAYAILDRSPV